MATSVTVSVVDRSVKGRVLAINGSTLTLRLASGGTSRIELPAGLAVIDGTARGGRSLVRVGAFVQIDGYLELSGTVRAASARILHPRVELVGTVIATAGGVTMRTSQGETYLLRFSSSSRISGGAVDLELRQNDIPVGARVHVEGQARSDGAVAVTGLAVRLAAVTVRGQIDGAQGNGLAVRVGQAVVQVRAGASTPVLQGSHTLALSDLVAGDDVTVYGYNGGKAIVIARKILVHRRLMGLDGTVAALSPDGFVLTASDGDHRVLVSAATIVSGAGVSPGVGDTVHVTGYQRGDGVILATRVRVRRAKTPYGVTSQDERQSIH
jgi:hypothetical protein